MAAAPIVSLAVVPPALARRITPQSDVEREPTEPQFTLAKGTGFAAAVLVVMVCEQTFLNAGPLLVKATADTDGAALAGFTFNVLLIARAPLQLFQAVQTSILPHLTRARAGGERDAFARSVNVTLKAIAGFAGIVALVMLVAGPQVMDLLFGGDFDYERGGLVLVAAGMGLYLSAATLNQAALARRQAGRAAAAWLVAAAAFLGWMVAPVIDDELLRAEVGYLGAAALLCGLLAAVYGRVG
jgi:O-antigen/teichoic acid export membrane protein